MKASFENFWITIFLFFLFIVQFCSAKKVSGKFKLHAGETTNFLAKFVFSPNVRGKVEIELTEASRPYPYKDTIRLYVFMDDRWPMVKAAPTCDEKIMFSYFSQTLTFNSVQNISIGNHLDTPRYWYIVVADCSLQNLAWIQSQMPEIQYNINIFDKVGDEFTHIPNDERGMQTVCLISAVFSFLMAIIISLNSSRKLRERGEVHISVFLIFVACIVHGVSTLCEYLHVRKYEVNGLGWYAADAMSAYMEALCDTIIAVLLLAIGGGWTLPSDIKPNSQSVTDITNSLFVSLTTFMTPRNGSYKLACVLFVILFLIHIILAQWGRTYSDDFDCYHDLEHLPGKILLLFRFLLGCFFLYSVKRMQKYAHYNEQLRSFYGIFSFIGAIWFIFLSTLAWLTSMMVPVYRRHTVVSAAEAFGQASALASLTWLLLGGIEASAYHKVSKVVNDHDVLGGGSSSLRFGKLKVRTD